MKAEGLLDAGWDRINLDDCWSSQDRDAKGWLVPVKDRFPQGMKPLADFVHGLGFKLGLYLSGGRTATSTSFWTSFHACLACITTHGTRVMCRKRLPHVCRLLHLIDCAGLSPPLRVPVCRPRCECRSVAPAASAGLVWYQSFRTLSVRKD